MSESQDIQNRIEEEKISLEKYKKDVEKMNHLTSKAVNNLKYKNKRSWC